jgi:multidrug efflux pump subunit AcrB
MDIVRYALDKPVSVAVAVILLVTFGLISLQSLPVQLTPDVETPQITVQTSWGGATPYEIEKEIVEKQEEALKGLQGLTKMESASYNNQEKSPFHLYSAPISTMPCSGSPTSSMRFPIIRRMPIARK